MDIKWKNMNKNAATRLCIGFMLVMLTLLTIVCGITMKNINQKIGTDHYGIAENAISDYIEKNDFNHSIFYTDYRYKISHQMIHYWLKNGKITDKNIPYTIFSATSSDGTPVSDISLRGTITYKGNKSENIAYGKIEPTESSDTTFDMNYNFQVLYGDGPNEDELYSRPTFSEGTPKNELNDEEYEYDIYYNIAKINKKIDYRNLKNVFFRISIPTEEYKALKNQWSFVQTQVAKASHLVLICFLLFMVAFIASWIIVPPAKEQSTASWWKRLYTEINILLIITFGSITALIISGCGYSLLNSLHPYVLCFSLAGIFLFGYLTSYYLLLCVSQCKGRIFIKSSFCYTLISTIRKLIQKYIKKQPQALSDYEKILKQIDDISNGNLRATTDLTEDSPYYPASQALEKIGRGMEESVKKQLQEERMKIELVTNVSHDLKTPLTSIISYIDLLSKMDTLDEEAKDYISILEKKSEQLKRLVTDLFELAKSTSGEAKIDLVTLDMEKLCEQMLVEMEDIIAESGQEIVLSYPQTDEPIHFQADADRMNRVFQNLLDNAVKYSMPKTRIFLTIADKENAWELSIKNTAAYRMNFTEQEILERFTRGDKARTTDGSGLGLSIAESFTKLCGGNFYLKIDGDQFNVFVSFPKVK